MSEISSMGINTAIWEEEAESDNPFAAGSCFCRGYDVYGELLGRASYFEYLYLLFKGARPKPEVAYAMERLAIAIANPGPRSPQVHAAMASSVAGSPAVASLMAALGPGAGTYDGAREVLLAMENWQSCGMDLNEWQKTLTAPIKPSRPAIWPTPKHVAGFDPHGISAAKPVRQTLAYLSEILPNGELSWLNDHREALEGCTKIPLAMVGVIAAALINMGFTPTEGEMLTLLLRLPGAAAHALEQWQRGFRQFPFFEVDLKNDPGPITKREQ